MPWPSRCHPCQRDLAVQHGQHRPAAGSSRRAEVPQPQHQLRAPVASPSASTVRALISAATTLRCGSPGTWCLPATYSSASSSSFRAPPRSSRARLSWAGPARPGTDTRVAAPGGLAPRARRRAFSARGQVAVPGLGQRLPAAGPGAQLAQAARGELAAGMVQRTGGLVELPAPQPRRCRARTRAARAPGAPAACPPWPGPARPGSRPGPAGRDRRPPGSRPASPAAPPARARRPGARPGRSGRAPAGRPPGGARPRPGRRSTAWPRPARPPRPGHRPGARPGTGASTCSSGVAPLRTSAAVPASASMCAA